MRRLLRSSVNLLPSATRTWIKHIPGIAGFQRFLVDHVLSGEPFIHTINAGPATGLVFEVTLPLDKAIWAGIYERDFAHSIYTGVRRGDVCFDIGGYRGYMSGAMALAGASKVLVFEPLPANQLALRRLCALNPRLNIELKPMAVGNVDGAISLRVMADASMGKLVTSTFQAGVATTGEIDVLIRRLDSLVQAQEIPVPQLIKVDVEGAELDVLLGASKVLGEYRPRIYIEAHSAGLEAACSQELVGHGYSVRRLELELDGDDQPRHLIADPQ